MNVHDAPFKRAQKFAFQHSHETREHDQIHLRLLQRVDKCALRVLVQFGAEFPRRNELRRNFSFARVRQNSRVLDIAQNQGDFGRNFSRRARVGNRDKVGAFAGAEDAQTEFVFTGHRIFLQAKRPDRQIIQHPALPDQPPHP